MRVYTIDQAAKIARVHTRTLRRQIAAGSLPAYKLGDTPHAGVRVLDADLRRWLTRRPVVAPEAVEASA